MCVFVVLEFMCRTVCDLSGATAACTVESNQKHPPYSTEATHYQNMTDWISTVSDSDSCTCLCVCVLLNPNIGECV